MVTCNNLYRTERPQKQKPVTVLEQSHSLEGQIFFSNFPFPIPGNSDDYIELQKEWKTIKCHRKMVNGKRKKSTKSNFINIYASV